MSKNKQNEKTYTAITLVAFVLVVFSILVAVYYYVGSPQTVEIKDTTELIVEVENNNSISYYKYSNSDMVFAKIEIEGHVSVSVVPLEQVDSINLPIEVIEE